MWIPYVLRKVCPLILPTILGFQSNSRVCFQTTFAWILRSELLGTEGSAMSSHNIPSRLHLQLQSFVLQDRAAGVTAS